MRLAAEQGLKVVLCTPSATPPVWLVAQASRDPDGRRARAAHEPRLARARHLELARLPAVRRADRHRDGAPLRRQPGGVGLADRQRAAATTARPTRTRIADRDTFRAWLRVALRRHRPPERGLGQRLLVADLRRLRPDRHPQPGRAGGRRSTSTRCSTSSAGSPRRPPTTSASRPDCCAGTRKNQWVTTNFMHLHKRGLPAALRRGPRHRDLDPLPGRTATSNEGPLGFRLGDGTAISFMGDFARAINGHHGLMELQPGQVNWGEREPAAATRARSATGSCAPSRWARSCSAPTATASRSSATSSTTTGIVGTDGVTLRAGGEEWVQAMREIARSARAAARRAQGAGRATRRAARRILYNVDNRFDLDNHPQTVRWDTMGHLLEVRARAEERWARRWT